MYLCIIIYYHYSKQYYHTTIHFYQLFFFYPWNQLNHYSMFKRLTRQPLKTKKTSILKQFLIKIAFIVYIYHVHYTYVEYI